MSSLPGVARMGRAFAVVLGSFATAVSQASAADAVAAAATPVAGAAPAPAPVPTIEIDAYDVDGNTLLQQSVIEDAVYPYLGPGKSRDDIENARRALERAYQAQGYQSVVVELPRQTVSAGIVKLHVIEAAIGKLHVTGAKVASDESIAARVPSLREGKVPNFTQAQKELAELNRTADRKVVPALKPGKTPGTVDVDLKVNDTLPLHGSLELNNDHGPSTSALRTTATLRYGDLWDLGHAVSVTAVLAPQRLDDAKVYAGSYLAPIPNSSWSILAYGYTSNSDVTTLGTLNVLGKGYAVGLRGILQLPPWEEASQSLNFGLDYKHSKEGLTLTEANGSSIRASIDYMPLSAAYSLQGQSGNSQYSATLSVTFGLRGIGSKLASFHEKTANASPNFVHLNLDFDSLIDLGSDFFADARVSNQISDGALVSTEQFSAGGMTSVRGYLQSEAIGDDGIFASLEFRSPSIATHVADFIDEWRFYVFGDAAKVTLLEPQPDQQSLFRLYSVGAGTRISLWRRITADAFVGLPLHDASASQSNEPYVQFRVKTEF